MRNAPKTAVKALFAAMEAAKDVSAQRDVAHEASAEPPAGRAIQVDLLWLSTMGLKGRA